MSSIQICLGFQVLSVFVSKTKGDSQLIIVYDIKLFSMPKMDLFHRSGFSGYVKKSWKILFPWSQWYGHPRVLGISIPKTLVIWVSPVTLTLTQIAKVIWEGDAHITRVLGIGIPTLSRIYRGNGYKLSARRFLGSFWWTSLSYDWLMVVLNIIDQS